MCDNSFGIGVVVCCLVRGERKKVVRGSPLSFGGAFIRTCWGEVGFTDTKKREKNELERQTKRRDRN